VVVDCADSYSGILCFFVAMTIAEGGGRRAVSNKLKDMYFPTLRTSYMIWPGVQMINFRLVPIQLQLVICPIPLIR
jgi:protein Mpv17